jgi:TRIAD3 protein (E3 ubiquitin-protein ligase RNF216)
LSPPHSLTHRLTLHRHRLLKASFPQRYAEDIEKLLRENDYQLYPTYLALDKDCWSPGAEPARVKKGGSRRDHPEAILRNSVIEAEMDALAAFDAARAVCEANAQARAEEKRKNEEEGENEKRARAEGTMGECGCCFDEKPLNRMVHCNGESAIHWFCAACARQMAEHAVGLSKYQLSCMSVDGCDATFSRDQRRLFLDDKLTTALELIEQQAVLRLAGIENLETCPFCPYAAEYPPASVNKEFRCENSECGLVSCRLCRQETHIPKTCSESARERGHSARRAIEEAMSAAMIRKCNKCKFCFSS